MATRRRSERPAETPITVHAYGVGRRLGKVGELPEGLGGAWVRSRPVEDLEVLFCVVDQRYGEEVWQARGMDPLWVGEVARAHHQVLQAWSGWADVLPFRLPSLHRSEAHLVESIASNLPALVRGLARIHGHWEWGLKVYAQGAPPEEEAASRPTTGRAYLVQRARLGAERATARDRRAAALHSVHRAFSRRAAGAMVTPPLDPVLSGRSSPLLLNAAYLVPKPKHPRTLARVWSERLRPVGLQLELSGPWPPYHFVETSEGAG